MQAFSFPTSFIQRVMICISCPKFSIMLNGKPCGYFSGKRGLRQGALSPYLFIMCTKVLLRLLDQAAIEGKKGYHHKCKVLEFHPKCKQELTPQIFADDLVNFTDASSSSLQGIKDLLEKFYSWYGFKVSLEKSEIFFSSVHNDNILIGSLGI